MAKSFEIRLLDESTAECAVMNVRGGIDADCSRELRTKVLEISEQGTPRVDLVLREVDLLASTGIGTLLLLTETLREKNQKLVLRDVSPAAQQVIGLLNLGSFLDVENTVPAGA